MMAANSAKRGRVDRGQVNTNEDWEVKYWISQFGCSEADLRAAIQAVGTQAVNVREYIRKQDEANRE
jgi:hypothetical protein